MRVCFTNATFVEKKRFFFASLPDVSVQAKKASSLILARQINNRTHTMHNFVRLIQTLRAH